MQTLLAATTRHNEAEQRSPLAFISWAPYCSRSDSIAARLGGRSYMIYSPRWGSRYATVAFKYISQAIKTLRVLVQTRPRIVFVMAPPAAACLPVWIYCRLTGSRFVIDAHTGAFLDAPWRSLPFIQKFFSRRAVTTIVTNQHWQQNVAAWGASATVVRDVPVCFANPERVSLAGDRHMTLVGSFCPDEPIEQFLEAAAQVSDTRFHITGDHSSLPARLLSQKPENVELTGFLSAAEYVGLLEASCAVIALTTRDNTMQRAAYEAIYLGKPVVTSDFPILRESFPKGAVHVQPTAADIVRGIRELQRDPDRYRAEAEQLRREKLAIWDEVAARLRDALGLEDATLIGDNLR